MENVTESETLKSAEHPGLFPPRRRRPLQSRTYCSLIHLLSHCRSDLRNSTEPQEVRQAETLGDNGVVDFKQLTEHNELTKNEDTKLENLLVQQEHVLHKTTGCMDARGGGFSSELEKHNLVQTSEETEVDGHISGKINFLGDSVEDKREKVDRAIENVNEQDNVSCGPEVHMEYIDLSREPELNKEVCASEAFEAMNSFFGIDEASESSKLCENPEGEDPGTDKFMSKEVEHQLLLKEIELEKLITNSGTTDLSHCVAANEEIEEGEISGEAGIYDDLMDDIFEDSTLLKENVNKEGQVSGVAEEVFTCDDVNRGFTRGEVPDSLSVDRGDDDNDGVGMELGESVVRESQSLDVISNSYMETQKADPREVSLANLSSCGKTLKEDTVENQVLVACEKAVKGDKKRKKGPLTEEKKAKRKKKQRIKRAEKNRKLGVKRLKLLPVQKPKTITYCRHYLKGRCLEGEKCKFSHDTVPSTKYTPCRHFARHTCMKGDDCPYDHQLSKYPCNNYTSKGFCSRGSDCLFSHEMPAGESSLPASNISKPEPKSQQQTTPSTKGSVMTSNTAKHDEKGPSMLSNLNSDKHLNHNTSYQNGSPKATSMDLPVKSVEQYVMNPTRGTTAQVPKGVNFLIHGRSLLGDSNRHKQAGSSLKADVDNISGRAMSKMSVSVQKSNEVAKTVPPRRPQGINFLSFGEVSSDDSNGKTSSSLLSTKIYEIEKSLSDDSAEGKQACYSQNSCDNVKVDTQTSQSTMDSIQKMNEKTYKVAAPRGTTFLSFGKDPLDDSSVKNLSGVHPGDSDIALPFVRGEDMTPDRIPTKMAPNPFGPSVDWSEARCSMSISSSLKPSLLNTASSVQRAVQSTLAFASKFEPEIKFNRLFGSPTARKNTDGEAGSS